MTGFTTIHAGSARQALTRLRFVCQLADHGAPPLSALNALVSDSIDLVVYCSRTALGPRVVEIVATEDLAGGPEATHFTVTPLFRRCGVGGPLGWTGELPIRLGRALEDAGFPPRHLLGPAEVTR